MDHFVTAADSFTVLVFILVTLFGCVGTFKIVNRKPHLNLSETFASNRENEKTKRTCSRFHSCHGN